MRRVLGKRRIWRGEQVAGCSRFNSRWCGGESCSKLIDCSPQRTLYVSDPSSHPAAAGWPLRNVLLYLSRSERLSPPANNLRVVLLREDEALTALVRLKEPETAATTEANARPATVGWERNEKGKLGPRMADLGPLMDPTRRVDFLVRVRSSCQADLLLGTGWRIKLSTSTCS